MSTNKFLTFLGNGKTLATAIAASVGAGDANKIVATGSNGKLDSSFMPVGVGVSASQIVASEALSAGDFVNIWSNTGIRNVRKADASNNRPANGFVLAAVALSGTVTVYQQGENTALTGLGEGTIMFLSASNAGKASATAPTASGHIIQTLGYALSTTSILYEFDDPISIA
ncbi:MAG TPA: hypothetical protein V6D10_05755 [Trichocoleus sp.]|jgi:hypothetical protein